MQKKIVAGAILVILTIYFAGTYLEIGKHKEKLWLHRTNSLEKKAEFKHLYPNIEVDVVIRPIMEEDSPIIDVTHDEDESFNLSLAEYMPEMKDGQKMWVDIKNLDENTVDTLLKNLVRYCSDYNLSKSQFILESRNHHTLKTLTESGFYTSYYVDFPQPSELDENEISTVIDSLQHVCDTKNVKAISFPAWWYEPIKKNLNRDIDLLTWAHRDTQYEFLLNPFRRKVLNDEQVKVILLKAKGKHHR